MKTEKIQNMYMGRKKYAVSHESTLKNNQTQL